MFFQIVAAYTIIWHTWLALEEFTPANWHQRNEMKITPERLTVFFGNSQTASSY